MKKIMFIILSIFMLVGNVSAESYVTSFYTVTNKCAVVKDNKVVIPVSVKVDNNKLNLTKLMEKTKIDYVTNYEDVLKLNIYAINNDNVNVYVDYKRNSVGESLVYFNILEDMTLKRHDELVGFNIGVEILNDVEINKMNVFGNEVVFADEKTCEKINGFKVTQIEKIVDINETDHSKYLNDVIDKCIISILSIALVICTSMLIRKKK